MTNKQRKKYRQVTATTGQRFDIMPSQVHGNKSRKTERRKAKQRATVHEWE
jgi:hypothetical protein